MTRELTAEMQAALQATVVRPIYFFMCEFEGSTLRLCTANFDVVWDGETWLGNGLILMISEVAETTEQRAVGMSVTLAGGNSALLSLVLSDSRQYKSAGVYFGLFDSSRVLIEDPIPLYEGTFDKATIKDNGAQMMISIDIEGDIINQKRIEEFRYTNQAQQALFSGDTGFLKVPQAAIWKGFWGKAAKVQFIRKRNLTRS